MKKELKQKRKKRFFKFYNEKNSFTILDKIMDIPSLEGFITVMIYLLMGVLITIAIAVGSAGSASMSAIVSNDYSVSQNAILFVFGVVMYILMTFLGMASLVCYDRNASKYKEPGVKIGKIVIVMFLVITFKDTGYIEVIKNFLL